MGHPAHSKTPPDLPRSYAGPTWDLLGLGIAHVLDRGLRPPVDIASALVHARLRLVDRDLGRLELVTFLHDGARFVELSAQFRRGIGLLLAVPAAYPAI